MHNNRYITIYTLVIALITSVVLALVVSVLKPRHDINEEIFKKKEILGAIKDQLGKDPYKLKDEEVLKLFSEKIEQVVIDAQGNPLENMKAEAINLASEEKKPKAERHYPLFIFNSENEKTFLLSIRGNGLWDKIWGYIALNSDLTTISGSAFGHAAETPGLGAEIKDNPNFPKMFIGKQIYEADKFVAIKVIKGGTANNAHAVDAISGATITSNGVADMLYNGLYAYLPYLEKLRSNKK